MYKEFDEKTIILGAFVDLITHAFTERAKFS